MYIIPFLFPTDSLCSLALVEFFLYPVHLLGLRFHCLPYFFAPLAQRALIYRLDVLMHKKLLSGFDVNIMVHPRLELRQAVCRREKQDKDADNCGHIDSEVQHSLGC